MTIVTTGSDDVIEQITKQLNRLIDVVKVVDLDRESVHRARADADQGQGGRQGAREEMKRMADIFADASSTSPTRPTRSSSPATASKLDAFIDALDRARDPRDRPHRRLGHYARRARPEGLKVASPPNRDSKRRASE